MASRPKRDRKSPSARPSERCSQLKDGFGGDRGVRKTDAMTDLDLLPGVSRSTEDREARSRDFGGMIARMPDGVAVPSSVEEVSSIVRAAARDGVPLAVRGGGHSQGGQSLSQGGLVLDTGRLDRIQPLGGELVRAQGGAQWGAVVDTLQGTGRLPRVLADIAEVSVGGTLSAGGLGTTSHRYGAQVGQVEQLEVVIGTGERVLCSRERNAALFDAVRAGQGRFGIITEAWIGLRRAGERIRQYQLRYGDVDGLVRDLDRMVRDGRVDHLRAETRAHKHDYMLHVGVEYDEGHGDDIILDGLGHDEVAASRDTADVGYAAMYPTWGLSRKNYHPWRDWIMPWEALPTLLAQPWVDPQWLPQALYTWTGVYPIRTEAIDAPLLVLPEGSHVLLYSILTVQHEREGAREMAQRLHEVDRTLVGLGGKSYVSGSVGYGRRQWEEHYGEALQAGLAWKRKFDPERVFLAEGMPFGEGP